MFWGQLDDTQNLSLRSNDHDHEDDLLNGKGQENIKSKTKILEHSYFQGEPE